MMLTFNYNHLYENIESFLDKNTYEDTSESIIGQYTNGVDECNIIRAGSYTSGKYTLSIDYTSSCVTLYHGKWLKFMLVKYCHSIRDWRETLRRSPWMERNWIGRSFRVVCYRLYGLCRGRIHWFILSNHQGKLIIGDWIETNFVKKDDSQCGLKFLGTSTDTKKWQGNSANIWFWVNLRQLAEKNK